jgi:hypothetical protein
MRVSPALAQFLADRRKTFNGRVASLLSRNPGFDTAALSAFLVNELDPLLARIIEVRPDGGAAFVDAAFDMALALVEQGCAGDGPRGRIVGQIWRDIAPAMAALVSSNPRETLGALSNAAIKLSALSGVDRSGWLRRLRQLADRVTSPRDLRSLTIIAAWRSGAAHLRTAALTAEIDPALACAAVGALPTAQWPALVEQFTAQRWWTPDGSTPPNGHRIGKFIGFGGDFAVPPQLGVFDNHFILSSADRHFLLEADGYGAILRRAEPEQAGASTPAAPARLHQGNQLRADDRLVPCDWPNDGLTIATTSESMAIVSPHSHSVHIFPRTMP